MASVFTMIINGDIPGRFVWKDEKVVAFLTIEPLAPGHVLVVPREEIEHWIDMPAELSARVFDVAQTLGKAIDAVWKPTKVGVQVVGLDVPHVHVHVFPATGIETFNFANVDRSPAAEDLDDAAAKIRAALTEAGHEQFVPER